MVAEGVCQHKVVVGCEVQELEPSVIGLRIAGRSTNFSPISVCIFCICAIADDKVCENCIVSS